jgi:hypothetical protein
MATIYLSSTYEDLKEHRTVVFEALRKSGYHVIAMEDYVAADQRPVDKCLKDVEQADIYVGLFAFRYGYVPPVEHDNPKGLSITELEFRHAAGLKKQCLTFVVKETTPWPPVFTDAQTSKDKGERINTLRQYLLQEKLASEFSSPYQLSTLVLAAVTKHLAQQTATIAASVSVKASIHIVNEQIECPHWSDMAEVRFSITNLSNSSLKLARLNLTAVERTRLNTVRLRKSGAPLREFNLSADISEVDEVDLLETLDVQFVLNSSQTEAFRLSVAAREGFIYKCILSARLDDLTTQEQMWIKSNLFYLQYPIRSVEVLRNRRDVTKQEVVGNSAEDAES